MAEEPVRTDPRRLERVLTNLLQNATRHGAPPVDVEVDGRMIRIRDHGPGLTIALAQAKVLGAILTLSNTEEGGALVTVAQPA